MANAGSISVTFEALTSDFHREMEKSQESMHKWNDVTKKVAIASAAAFAGMSAAIGLSLREMSKGEDAMMRLQASFRASGQAFDKQRAIDFASALQNLTNVADDVTHNVQGMLATFGFTQGQTETLLPRIVNLSKAMGVDLNAAAKMVGKSIDSGLVTLDDYGIKLNKAEAAAFAAMEPTERLAAIVDILDGRFKGVAETMAGSFSGQLTRVRNDIGDLFEEVGKLINGSGGGDGLRGISDMLQSATKAIADLTPEAKAMIGQIALGTTVVAGLSAALAGVATILPQLAAGVGMLTTAFKGLAVPAAAVLVSMAAIITAVGAAENARRRLQDLATGRLTPGSTTYDPEAAAASEKSLFEDIKAGFGTGIDMMLQPIKDGFADLFQNVSTDAEEASQKVDEAAKKTRASLASRAPVAVMDFGGGAGSLDLSLESVAETFARSLSESVGEYREELVLDADEVLQDRFRMVERVADEVAFDLEHTFRDSGSALIDSATGGTTALGDAFNALADVVGPELANKMADFVEKVVPESTEDLSDAAGAMGGQLLSGISGQAGGLISATGQGAAAGGPFGAIAGAIGYLLTQTESFTEILNMFTDVIDALVEVLEPVMKAVKPLVAVSNEMLIIIAEQLAPVLEGLTPVFHALFTVVKGVGLAVAYVVKGIGDAWNGIVNAIASIFDKLADIEFWGIRPLGFMDSWADGVRKASINMNGVNDAIRRLKDTTIASAEAAGRISVVGTGGDLFPWDDEAQEDHSLSVLKDTDALDDHSDALQEATESLLNMPQGFKIAAARFEATMADTAASANFKAYGGPEYNARAPIVIESLNISASDPQNLWDKLKALMEREAVVATGSSVGSRTIYTTKSMVAVHRS